MLKLEDGADLVVVELKVAAAVQAVTAAKVGVPRAAATVLGRRCEFCPTRSAESRIDNALIVII